MTVIEFVASVPIIPALGVEAATAWYRDELGYEVFHAEAAYGNLVAFFEPEDDA